jgi:hypothetical protein
MLGLGPEDLEEGFVSGRSILTAAVVALIVVIGYDRYKQAKGM